MEGQYPATGPILAHRHLLVSRVEARPDPAQNGARGAARQDATLSLAHNIILWRGPPKSDRRHGRHST